MIDPQPLPRRVAVLSVHTSPLEQPGTGDAGGMNVYVLQTALCLAQRGVEVEIFTRATSSSAPAVVRPAAGVVVRNVVAGPFAGLDKDELPAQLCAFTAGVLRAEARHDAGYYDLVHSHYWLSGQVGWLARDRWGVPLVHTAHTLGKVKNAALAAGDTPEPKVRLIGEQQVVDEAGRLVANTAAEARQLVELYGADPARVDTIAPGADLQRFRVGDRAAARAGLGIASDEVLLSFVGRIQPLKAPDVLLRAAAELMGRDPTRRLRVLIVGGPSGSGLDQPQALVELAGALEIAESVTFLPPQPPELLAKIYRASDVVAVPSHSESFGLVALEAQACGTPVVAADVGGLGVAVLDGVTGLLVPTHRTQDWADALARVVDHPGRRHALAEAAPGHAAHFSWERTAEALLHSYAQARSAMTPRPTTPVLNRPRSLRPRRSTGVRA